MTQKGHFNSDSEHTSFIQRSTKMEGFLEEATSKGLQVVDNTRLAESYQDYEEIISKADALCEITDPEDTPYVSKYKARDLLDPLCNRMEANRTIASLEKQKKIMEELDWRIASLRFRLGSIAWDVEEPHNTQIELELAAVCLISTHFPISYCYFFFSSLCFRGRSITHQV